MSTTSCVKVSGSSKSSREHANQGKGKKKNHIALGHVSIELGNCSRFLFLHDFVSEFGTMDPGIIESEKILPLTFRPYVVPREVINASRTKVVIAE
jgi:hypothetical protein